jgi:hypothetical protein
LTRTLHIAPGDSAGGSLRAAVRESELDADVLSWLDDLSCGPIASGDAAERAAWWAHYDDRPIEGTLNAFWDAVAKAEHRLVVWFSSHRASQLSFLLAWADRLRDRPYEYIDVAGRQVATRYRDGSSRLSRPLQSVGLMNRDALRSLFGSEQPAAAGFCAEAGDVWRRLKAENAPFRVVTDTGLVSAPVDIFDPWLLERADGEWCSIAHIVSETMGYNSDPYIQVGDVMLHARIVALVEEGKLVADGDPRQGRSCRVRLPGPSSP